MVVASCRGDLSFRRIARKATPVRLGDQDRAHGLRDVLDYICSSRNWHSRERSSRPDSVAAHLSRQMCGANFEQRHRSRRTQDADESIRHYLRHAGT